MDKLLTFVFMVSTFGCSQPNEHIKQKRILLNDPDVVGARLANLEQTVQTLTQTVSQLQTALAQERANCSNLGSTYIRWGRKQCETANTDLVYSGYTTGQAYYRLSHAYGGPANMLCLPNNPNVSNRTTPGGSMLFGSEFQDGDYFAKGAEDEDVPCVLCRSKNTGSSVMFPGRDTCYSGWKMEYQGILASGHIDYRPSSYICVDRNPEFLQGGERSNNENLLYATRTQCGSLPCPPYDNNMEINCVVCSK